jgi:hypothetical protein
LSAGFNSVLARFIMFFEPISPRFISFAVRNRLAMLKKNGLINDYRTETRRIGKLHYRIEVNLEFTEQQASRVLDRALKWILKRTRR